MMTIVIQVNAIRTIMISTTLSLFNGCCHHYCPVSASPVLSERCVLVLLWCDLDAFTRWLKGQYTHPASVVSAASSNFPKCLFTITPASNVHSERRFSRSVQHQRSSCGNNPEPAALAANHMLTESKTVLDTTTAHGAKFQNEQGSGLTNSAERFRLCLPSFTD